jgi:hypothetical protein
VVEPDVLVCYCSEDKPASDVTEGRLVGTSALGPDGPAPAEGELGATVSGAAEGAAEVEASSVPLATT